MFNQNAVEIFKEDHDRIKKLFSQYEATGSAAYETKQWIAQQVFRELNLHSQLEEQIFYPAVQMAAPEAGNDFVLESLEEQHIIDVLIEELRDQHPVDETYEPKFRVLRENVEHHIEEEESELFPVATEELGHRLNQLGDEIWRRREALILIPQ